MLQDQHDDLAVNAAGEARAHREANDLRRQELMSRLRERFQSCEVMVVFNLRPGNI
jgi:hypothetical protein